MRKQGVRHRLRRRLLRPIDPVHHAVGRHTADAKDTIRKFNRTENVRPIPPDDPAFDELFRRRNDAESINRALEDTLWLNRAHSLGHRRQLLNLLGYAVMVNSLAVARAQRRQQLAA